MASARVTRKYKFQGDVERGASERESGGGTGDGLAPGAWSVFRDSYSVFMGLLSPSKAGISSYGVPPRTRQLSWSRAALGRRPILLWERRSGFWGFWLEGSLRPTMLSGGVRTSVPALEIARLTPGKSGASVSSTSDRPFEGCEFMFFLRVSKKLPYLTVPYRDWRIEHGSY